MNYKAADFISTTGERIQSFQYIEDGRAVMVADFRDGKLDRYACSKGQEKFSQQFRAWCYKQV